MRIFLASSHFFNVYRCNLPHSYPVDANVFVTWRLCGSQPPAKIIDGATFRAMDRQLDLATAGPLWLKQPRVSETIVEVIESAEPRGLCTTHEFVVMPNHVHILIRPISHLKEVTRWIKGVSARKANLILGRTGQPLWQDESFDHWVRNDAEFEKIRNYIWNNPVRAGLTSQPEQWPYSSIGRDRAKAATG